MSWNGALPWSIDFIKQFYEYYDEDCWDLDWDWQGWAGFGSNVVSLPGMVVVIEDYHLQWNHYEGNFDLSCLAGVIDRNKAYWKHRNDAQYTDRLDWNETTLWKLGIFERHENFMELSLPWNAVNAGFIECYEEHWGWGEPLSKSSKLIWSAAFIEHYKDRWDWGNLSDNEALPWSEDFIDRYAEHWDWRSLSWNEALPWSVDLIDHYRYVGRWDWGRLTWNQALPWSEDFIDRYAEHWDWRSLSRNKALPWSHRFYERYAENWNINEVAQIYDGNICKLSREQIIRLLEDIEQSMFWQLNKVMRLRNAF